MSTPMKTNAGNFFEDFRLGQSLVHATPRTLTEGDVSLYTALYGPRFALQSADSFARKLGFPKDLPTTFSYSTSCSARRCRTSRSTRWPISATRKAGF